MRRIFRWQLLCLCMLWLSAAAGADSGWLQTPDNPYSKVRLRADQSNPQQTRLLLDIHLANGWKTYWRSPGEAGVAASIRWQGEVPAATWYWPVPQRFDVSGISTQGYQQQVTLPMVINGTTPEPLAGVLTLATCRDVCLLSDYAFSLDAQSGVDGDFNYAFTRAMGQVPLSHGLSDNIQAGFSAGVVTISAWRASGWHQPALFLDDIPGAGFARPVFYIDDSMLYATVALRPSGNHPLPDLRGTTVNLVLADQGLAQESSVTLANQSLLPAGISTHTPWWQALLLALAGGLILNFMPCVLPVLGLKLATILQVQQQQRHEIRRQFIASSCGILLSFLLLALFMTLLRLAGSVPGWGIQFQNPWFIGFMALLMCLFSASLFGLFEINLPGWLHHRLAAQKGTGLRAHVWQGAFATLLATPCSAPFLGTALAVALIAPLPLLWIIFTALGIGMSLPWLLIAAWPALVLHLPRPGRWMLWLRSLFALFMLLSALWLLSLLNNHLGQTITGILIATTLILLLLATGWRYGLRPVLWSVPVLLMTAAGFFGISNLSSHATGGKTTVHWQPLSEQAIIKALSEQKRVFVDITADWCVTCKVNEYNVFSRQDIQALLNAPDVVALRGDWSRPSTQISNFLQHRGSVAIPFTQVYRPPQTNGEVLPVLLTPDNVIQALTSDTTYTGKNQ